MRSKWLGSVMTLKDLGYVMEGWVGKTKCFESKRDTETFTADKKKNHRKDLCVGSLEFTRVYDTDLEGLQTYQLRLTNKGKVLANFYDVDFLVQDPLKHLEEQENLRIGQEVQWIGETFNTDALMKEVEELSSPDREGNHDLADWNGKIKNGQKDIADIVNLTYNVSCSPGGEKFIEGEFDLSTNYSHCHTFSHLYHEISMFKGGGPNRMPQCLNFYGVIITSKKKNQEVKSMVAGRSYGFVSDNVKGD